MIDYLTRILNARVYDVANETPLLYASKLSSRYANSFFLKREDLQPVFSFKIRGAYNKIANLSSDKLKNGVICASAGNHAQGVAMSAAKLGCRAVIVMPQISPHIKVDAVKARGGEVVLFGQNFDEAYAHAVEIGIKEKLTFVHPFDDPDVIAGQGTIAMEILRQIPNNKGSNYYIFCSVGGGGLVAGIATYIKLVRPDIKVIGVETFDADAMTRSLDAKQRICLSEVGNFADGTAVKQVGEETFRLCQKYLDGMISVNTDDICAAIKDVFEDTRCILEPSGAMSVAGAKAYAIINQLKNQHLIAVTSGANINFDRLRFAAERAEYGEQREILLTVTLKEQPGEYKRFVSLIGALNITEFNYRYNHFSEAHVFVGLQVTNRQQATKFIDLLRQNDYEVIDLTENEVAKMHLRHLVGGHLPKADLAKNNFGRERIFRFEFPEKPGALKKFLNEMGDGWNISLFHYRNHGADTAKILIGLQVPEAEDQQFEQFLSRLGYRYWEESDNPIYSLFLS